MVKSKKGKSRSSEGKPAPDRREYFQSYESKLIGLRLRFKEEEQLNKIRRAAELTSAPSLNSYIVASVVAQADRDLTSAKALSSELPAQ